jgi:hypothetical protein
MYSSALSIAAPSVLAQEQRALPRQAPLVTRSLSLGRKGEKVQENLTLPSLYHLKRD